MGPETKKINKIYNQIDKLATKGKEYVYEYYKLIDDIISKGNYSYLEVVFFYFYNIDINDEEFLSVDDVKKKTWNTVLFYTNSSLAKKIKKVYDDKSVYQVGFDIFKEIDNTKLGQIVEVDQFSPDSKYYIQNKDFARLMGTRVTYLEVTKTGATSSVIIDTTDVKLSEENNLVNRYKNAINYLLV